MRILGIDPGTARLGYGLIDYNKTNKKVTMLKYGCLTTPSGMPAADRLHQLYHELRDIIKKEKPDKVAVEELFFFKNLKTAIKVAEARGVILLAARESKVEISEHTPLEVKLAIVGYGRADKSQIQKMVKVLLQLDKIPKSDDAADALAVALTSAYTKKLSC